MCSRHPVKIAWLALCLSIGSALTHAETLRIGAEDDWYPYTALRDGKMQGMSVDIVRAAFAASDTQIELVPYPYSRCMETAERGDVVACFNTLPDKKIATDYLLPNQPLFQDDILLWANREDAVPVKSLQSLAWQRVATTIGYEYGAAFDAINSVVRVPVRRDINGFLMLERGRVDFTAAYRGTAQALFAERPELADAFTPVATLVRAQLFLSFSRHNPQAPAALRAFEQGMQIIHTNGVYKQILDHWHFLSTAE